MELGIVDQVLTCWFTDPPTCTFVVLMPNANLMGGAVAGLLNVEIVLARGGLLTIGFVLLVVLLRPAVARLRTAHLSVAAGA